MISRAPRSSLDSASCSSLECGARWALLSAGVDTASHPRQRAGTALPRRLFRPENLAVVVEHVFAHGIAGLLAPLASSSDLACGQVRPSVGTVMVAVLEGFGAQPLRRPAGSQGFGLR
jgi:hypothetical protein